MGSYRPTTIRDWIRERRDLVFGSRRPVGFALGIGLQFIVLLYAASVLWTGGLINPKAPRDIEDFNQKLAHERALRQDPDSLLAAAVANAEQEEAGKLLSDLLDVQLPRIVQRHNWLRQGQILPQDGAIGDLDRYNAEEKPNLPDRCIIGVDSVTILSVEYIPGKSYDFIGGTRQSPKEIYKTYLTQINQLGWEIELPLYDEQKHIGLIQSSDGDWRLNVVIAPTAKLRDYNVVVFWSLEKLI